MITDYEKWDYLTAVKLSTRAKEITLNVKAILIILIVSVCLEQISNSKVHYQV